MSKSSRDRTETPADESTDDAPVIKPQGVVESAALDNVNAGWISRALLGPVFAACVMLIAYFLLPFNQKSDWNVLGSVVGALLLLAFCLWEIRSFLHATYPLAAALEMLAALVMLYLISFSTVYFIFSDYDPGSFNEHLTRMDALYFCLTVFTTTGFGDIDALTQGARIAVSIQMVSNLILIGLGFRLFSMVVTARLRASQETS